MDLNPRCQCPTKTPEAHNTIKQTLGGLSNQTIQNLNFETQNLIFWVNNLNFDIQNLIFDMQNLNFAVLSLTIELQTVS